MFEAADESTDMANKDRPSLPFDAATIWRILGYLYPLASDAMAEDLTMAEILLVYAAAKFVRCPIAVTTIPWRITAWSVALHFTLICGIGR